MKKKILIALIVFLIVGIAIWKITTNKTSSDVDNTSKNSTEASDGISGENNFNNNSSSGNSVSSSGQGNINENDDTSTNIGNISGFTPEQGTASKDTNKTNQSSEGISLPYTISTTGMKIKSIGKYSGEFVEDGSDKKVSNILSIVVTNTSNKALQYGEIKLKVNENKTAIFKLTNVPSGKSVLAIETNCMKYNSSDNYKYEDATYAHIDSMQMNSNKVKISTADSNITIKNTSDKDLGTVYVYYKNLDKSGAYLGGITYRVKFEDVKKGETLSQNTKHFSKANSKIIMVDTEK